MARSPLAEEHRTWREARWDWPVVAGPALVVVPLEVGDMVEEIKAKNE